MAASFWNALDRSLAGLWGLLQQPGRFRYQERAQPLLARFTWFLPRLGHQLEVHLRHPPLERLPCLPDAGLAGGVNRLRLHTRLPGLALVGRHLAPSLDDLLDPGRDRDG